ncbi:hypothetical protein AB0C13_13695 [Streptomyces sp. NPDC049099]|uniref:hypothetical protein n=1 Tax=Streptomyces sp. NPDC049099 TaxID=3155768 RepID=UPI00342EF14F
MNFSSIAKAAAKLADHQKKLKKNIHDAPQSGGGPSWNKQEAVGLVEESEQMLKAIVAREGELGVDPLD